MRVKLLGIFLLVAALVFLLVRTFEARRPAQTPTPTASQMTAPASGGAAPDSSTVIYAHNLLLRQGPGLQVYVNWLHGHLTRAHSNVIPSFDEPNSFFIDIDTGALHVSLDEISAFLNASGLSKTSLRNIRLSGVGNQLKLNATLRKVVPLPIEVTSVMSPLPDGRIQLHILKIAVVKIPVRGLLRGLNLKIADLFNAKSVAGVQVTSDDIFLDGSTLMPAPHIRGHLTAVRIVNSTLDEVYGKSTEKDEIRVEQWRNFLRLRGGTLTLGRLTMHGADIIMIDTSNDQWFELDLAKYEEQLVNGYIRMTPEAGLQIFMPDLSLIPKNKANAEISIEWMKNRNVPPPPDVTSR
ncbi:MAG: hypothetical protein WA324_22480 [Bryobacteraceae bacterium]